ncbi:MAG: FMN-binding protein [Candidatus Moranbacteria bacterium]|nr:FMN-binding protein [Candidatus Moranbacteria bacterium]
MACKNNELKKVRSMQIDSVDFSTLKNGNHRGDFRYGDFTYTVEVFVCNSQIKAINVLENRNSKYARMAEGVTEKVLRQQRNDVDVVSGATTTSKALLKAIENALRSEPVQ